MQTTQEKAAASAVESGDFARASSIYVQLLDRKKLSAEDKARYQIALADIDRRAGQYESAIAQYDNVLDTNSTNIDALEGKGLALMAQGNIAEAGQIFKAVLAADATRWRTLNALGIMFTSKNMVPEAMAYFAEGLKVSKNNAAILNNVGLTQAINHNYPRALQAMKQAVRTSANDTRKKQIELNMALIYGISGDFDNARAVAEKHLKGPTLENNLGLYAHLANNQELAKAYLNQALSSSTTYYERAWKNLDIISGKSVE
jgi:Flp pilus assembly protein TadD